MRVVNLFFWAGIAVASTLHGLPSNISSTGRGNISASQQPDFTFDELYSLQKQFLDHFISPANVQEAKAINSTLLAEDCLGRVDITRTFSGRELNTEYLFGLFANLAATPDSLSLLGVPISYEILHFAANQNIASAATKSVFLFLLFQNLVHVPPGIKTDPVAALYRFMFNFTALNLVLPIRIDTWNSFNAQKQISQYDATFVWWDWAFATLLEAAVPVLGVNSTAQVVQALTGALAKSICSTATTYCKGTDAQYGSTQECEGYLTKEIRFGAPYELGTL
ncbi:MAG: hypothetical protein HETSPECPRED_000980 [Heterodermia speciosa]|uniref:Uncharacterized protein n=1 Tax=Heterodermia speciosa TaxID=116794 RepID=A0A8H3ETS8_9LECA|nr:MAG: hypothetical protein HETSPECPRED_000980 [Heterodermia speciosa]